MSTSLDPGDIVQYIGWGEGGDDADAGDRIVYPDGLGKSSWLTGAAIPSHRATDLPYFRKIVDGRHIPAEPVSSTSHLEINAVLRYLGFWTGGVDPESDHAPLYFRGDGKLCRGCVGPAGRGKYHYFEVAEHWHDEKGPATGVWLPMTVARPPEDGDRIYVCVDGGGEGCANEDKAEHWILLPPLPEPPLPDPLPVGDYECQFLRGGSIKVGCQNLSFGLVKCIYETALEVHNRK